MNLNFTINSVLERGEGGGGRTNIDRVATKQLNASSGYMGGGINSITWGYQSVHARNYF